MQYVIRPMLVAAIMIGGLDLLLAQPPATRRPVPFEPAPMGGEAEEEPAAPARDCHRVALEDGSNIIGELESDAKLQLKSKIGDVEISSDNVARIDRAFVDEKQFTMTLSNGDRLTGTLSLNGATLKTAWGTLPLKLEGLYSLESGKLYEQSAPVTRRSIDGRTTVTIERKHFRFQPSIPAPGSYSATPPAVTSAYSASPTVLPPTTTYTVPAGDGWSPAPITEPPRPTRLAPTPTPAFAVPVPAAE